MYGMLPLQGGEGGLAVLALTIYLGYRA